MKYIIIGVLFSTLSLAQIERWIYIYDGADCISARAGAMTCDSSNNIYAAGYCWIPDSMDDMLVVSLTCDGDTNWTYRYNCPENGDDRLCSIEYGVDGNIYAAGHTWEPGGLVKDFAVISLTNAGDERWIYRYNNPDSIYESRATAMTLESDGNIYASGYISHSGAPYVDFLVVSLTSQGTERWVYTFDGPGNYFDVAQSITYGNDRVYITGYSETSGSGTDLIVICLDTSGVEQWIFSYSTPGWDARGKSIIVGADNNVYVAGWTGNPIDGRNSYSDFTIMSLSTNGDTNWIYIYTAQNWYSWDEALAVIYGLDSHIYACGFGEYAGTQEDAVVIGLTTDGNDLWIYRYDGIGVMGMDEFNYIDYGLDHNIYACGYLTDTTSSSYKLLAVSLSNMGNGNWVYTYDGPGDGCGEAKSIFFGPDSNVYIAGYCNLTSTLSGFIVISLDPATGVEEGKVTSIKNRNIVPTIFSGPLLLPTGNTYKVFDITGRIVMPDKIRPGIYFIEIEGKITRKVVKIR